MDFNRLWLLRFWVMDRMEFAGLGLLNFCAVFRPFYVVFRVCSFVLTSFQRRSHGNCRKETPTTD